MKFSKIFFQLGLDILPQDFQEYEEKYKKMHEIYKEYFYLHNISSSSPEENSSMLKDMDFNLKDFSSFVAIYYELKLKPGFY